MANRTYHVDPHTGDTWQYAFTGDDGVESRAPLPECERQGAEISALARVAEELVRETGGVEHQKWTVGAIRRARYRRGEWMTREDTEAIFPVATKGPAAAQWRGQAVHIIFPDDRAGSRGMVEVEVRHTYDFTMSPDPKIQLPDYRRNRRGRDFPAAASIFGSFCEICANSVRY